MTTYWTHIDDDTEIRYETPEEAAEYAINQMEPEPGDEYREITVFEVTRKKISGYHLSYLKQAIEAKIDEYLGPKYGNPDEVTGLPSEIQNTIESLMEDIWFHWPVHVCTPTGNKVTKTIKEWEQILA